MTGKTQGNQNEAQQAARYRTIGIIGGIVGLAAAPWAFIAATIATLGFGCKIEIVKKDGSTDEIL